MKIRMIEQVIEVEDDVGMSLLMGQVDTDKVVQPVPVLRKFSNGKEKIVHVEIRVPLRYEEVVEDGEE